MFRTLYDGDATTWSPQGRLHQVEYAMEAVKQGSACVGLKSKDFVVIATLKRSTSELGAYQKKVFKISENIGIAIAGLTADARVLCRYMRTECLNHQYVFDENMNAGRLVQQIADKSQVHTQRYGRRPYGVGLLVAGFDSTGTHLYETSPSGNFYDYKAQAIGARSQSARTYLEKNFLKFDNCSQDELIKHALFALRETTASASEGITAKNVSIGIVGINKKFEILEGNALQPYLEQIDQEKKDSMKTE